ncbi:MAG: hypothetical protein NVSMB9_08580 [Isosphaeraceae bacterium]
MLRSVFQIALLIVITHGVRSLARRLGLRWSGLLMGIPSTTAFVLIGCGLERGLEEAILASEACLAGLVAASALPLMYALAARVGWNSPLSATAAVTGYGVIATSLWWLPGVGAVGCVTAATAGVYVACHLAKRVREAATPARAELPLLNRGSWALACRTAVPTFYAVTIAGIRALTGTSCAGRFITFPGTSLTVLVTTHLESGPGTACQLALAMPAGGLGMLAFLTAFRFGCPPFGLALGTLIGFAAAFAALGSVGYLIDEGGSWTRSSTTGNRFLRTGKYSRNRLVPGRLGMVRRDPATAANRSTRVRCSRVRRSARRRHGFAPRIELLSR